MKRRLIPAMAVLLAMFVALFSCDSGVEMKDTTATLKFIGIDDASSFRGLNKTNPKFDASAYAWKYTATKMDDTGLKTGEQTIATAFDMNEPVGPFSLGTWKFCLYAYVDDDSYSKLVYAGSSQAEIRQGSNSVPVTVTAFMTGKNRLVKNSV